MAPVRIPFLSRLLVALTLLWAPYLSHAQDMRLDEGPELEPGGANTGPHVEAGLFTEPQVLANVIDSAFDRLGHTGTPRNGVYVELSNMITGSGWVSVGPGYRRDVLNGKAFVDASAAVSWRAYNMIQARFEVPELFTERFSGGAQVMWQDQMQINYFGIGPNSIEDDQSQYRMQSIDTVGYATYRPAPSLAITGEFGFLRRPDILSPSGLFRPSVPTTTQEFPDDPGVSDPFQPNYAHTELSVTSDTRDHRSYPTSGHVLRGAVTSFVDQSTSVGTFTFDQNLLLTNVESRWALWTRLDGALFLDAGNVGARVQDLNLDKLSVGGGVRLHTGKATFARLDVAFGAEGWNAVFRTSDPLRLARLTRRVAAVPFVP